MPLPEQHWHSASPTSLPVVQPERRWSMHQAQRPPARATSRWRSPALSLASVHKPVPSQTGQVILPQPPHSGHRSREGVPVLSWGRLSPGSDASRGTISGSTNAPTKLEKMGMKRKSRRDMPALIECSATPGEMPSILLPPCMSISPLSSFPALPRSLPLLCALPGILPIAALPPSRIRHHTSF